MSKKAFFAKKLGRSKEEGGMKGNAAVYRLEPPFEGYEFVVASSVDLRFGGGSETLIFPSDGDRVTSFLDLAGVAWSSHEDALNELGYAVVYEEERQSGQGD